MRSKVPTIKIRRRTIALGALVAILGAGLALYLTTWGANASPDVQRTPAALHAQEVAIAMLTISDPKDATGWQKRLEALSSEEGRAVWGNLLAQGWWRDIEARRLVTDRVTITRARESGPSDGTRRTVQVSGTVKGHGATGVFEREFAYGVALVLDSSGSWQFVSFQDSGKER